MFTRQLHNMLPGRCVLALCLAVAVATDVNQCIPGSSPSLSSDVSISNCESGICRLRRNHFVDVEYKFTIEESTETVKNSVKAILGNIPFPYIGIDGLSACISIYDEFGTTQVGCPLKSKTNYIYKQRFNILPVYPKIHAIVHWELVDDKNNTIKCFEIPAKITR